MKKTKNYLNRNFKKERSDDLLPTEKRSELMAKIRSRDTKFEQEFIFSLRKATRKKFRTNVALIKGKPDVVFQKDKVCIFLDSDFWHGWYYPRWKHLLKNDFWREKIQNNRKRDRKITAYLRKNGWTVLRFWEHEIKKDPARAISRTEKALWKSSDRSIKMISQNFFRGSQKLATLSRTIISYRQTPIAHTTVKKKRAIVLRRRF